MLSSFLSYYLLTALLTPPAVAEIRDAHQAIGAMLPPALSPAQRPQTQRPESAELELVSLFFLCMVCISKTRITCAYNYRVMLWYCIIR